MQTTIWRAHSGDCWIVKVTTEKGSATVNVTDSDYAERGQVAFDEAVNFLSNTIESGY